MREFVSVVIVNWNGKEWLKKCLDSLLNQTYKELEIILIDNASSDDSVQYVKKNYNNITLIQSKKNLGLTNGINLGIEKCKGKYILLVNNDVWMENDFIQKIYEFYKKNNYSVIAPEEKRYDKSQDFLCNTTIDITGSPAYFIPTYSKPDKIFYLSVCFFCSKREYLDSGGLDKDFFMYNEDVDWFWRLSLFGKKFTYVKDVFIYHAGAGSTGSGIKYNTFLWRNQNSLQMLIKNYSISMLFITLPIYLLQNIFEILFFILILKPKIAFSYIQGLVFNIRNLRRTIRKRRWIQSRRIVGEFEIIKKMYVGFGKLLFLKNYLKRKL